MQTSRSAVAAMLVVATNLILFAQDPSPADAQLNAADAAFSDRHYKEALAGYQQARASTNPDVRVRGGVGAVKVMLRVGQFHLARTEAATVAAADPSNDAARAIYGDALWSDGLFFEAEKTFDNILSVNPRSAPALNGRARSLLAQGRLDEALSDITAAIEIDPREATYVHTLAEIHEGARRFDAAAAALEHYLAIVPPTEAEATINWARSRMKLFRSFKNRPPAEIIGSEPVFTVPFHVDGGHVIVRASVNGRTVDMTVDTGADEVVLTPDTARRAGVISIATIQSAGVGSAMGFREMQVSRIDQLKIGPLTIDNVISIIKAPAMTGLPVGEKETFSPLALGLSVIIDYQHNALTMARELPAGEYTTRLPLRFSRLAFVRATINGTTPASFVVDTGGEASVLSRQIAAQLDIDPGVRKVPVRVYGSSGWDRGAFLLPYVDVQLAQGVGLEKRSLIVLNLDAPSALLGVNVGGLLGYEFLRKYVVAIDLVRHELGLRAFQ